MNDLRTEIESLEARTAHLWGHARDVRKAMTPDHPEQSRLAAILAGIERDLADTIKIVREARERLTPAMQAAE